MLIADFDNYDNFDHIYNDPEKIYDPLGHKFEFEIMSIFSAQEVILSAQNLMKICIWYDALIPIWLVPIWLIPILLIKWGKSIFLFLTP